jgi:hypothetical protein
MGRTTTRNGPWGSAPECFGDPVNANTVVSGGARVDSSQFPRADRVAVAVGAAAAKGDRQVTVTALAGPIPAGRLIYLTGGKVIRLALAAGTGAVLLHTQPIEAALVGTETGEYTGSGRIEIPKGTPLGRTIAERNAGTGFGPAVAADDEVFLLARMIIDAADIDDCTLYRHGYQVYENLLPGIGSMDAGLLTKLRGLYTFLTAA